MTSTGYEDFKYMLQDAGSIYFGAKYTYRELLDNPETSFKFRAIVEHYILKSSEADTSLESDFYYMEPESFAARTFMQLKTKVKVAQIVEKKTLFGKKTVYADKVYALKDFMAMNLAVKKKTGIVVQEIIINKLALMGFSV